MTGEWAGCKHILTVGVEKCGTTSLHAYLSEHPDISAPPGKELFYFNRYYGRGAGWYSSLFDLTKARAALDFTPSYFRSSEALDRIEAFPSSKFFLFLMRHPVRRAYSFYLHDINLVISKGRRSHSGYRRTDFSFKQLFAERHDRYFTRYADHAAGLLKRFSRERVCCLIFEEVVADIPRCRDRLSAFLDMDLESLGSVLPWRNRQQIPRFLYPGNHRVFQTEFGTIELDESAVYRCERGVPIGRVDIDASRIEAVRKLEGSYDLSIDRAFCEEVHDSLFREDIQQLEDLLKLDLESWAAQTDLAASWDAPLVHYEASVTPHLTLCTLAEAFLDRGQRAEAKRTASKAVELAPSDPRVLALLSHVEFSVAQESDVLSAKG